MLTLDQSNLLTMLSIVSVEPKALSAQDIVLDRAGDVLMLERKKGETWGEERQVQAAVLYHGATSFARRWRRAHKTSHRRH